MEAQNIRNIRSVAMAAIDKLYERRLSGVLAAFEVSVQQVMLGNLESHYARFTEAHMDLVGEATPQELEEHNVLFEAVEEKYTLVKAALCGAIEVKQECSVGSFGTARTAQRGNGNDIRLEKINLPKFSGEFTKWIGFRDMFEAMVHKSTHFSTAAKYTRLVNALQGNAAQVIAGFLPTDDNYEAAWNTLKERYDNDRLIVASHLNTFLGMESLQKETSNGLRRMVDITNETTRSLEALKRPVEHWDDILVHILVSKLPRASIIHWEMEQKGTDLPKLKELLSFLEGRARGLDHMGPSSVEKPSTSNSSAKKPSTNTPKAHTSTGSNTSKVSSGNCYHCQGNHHVGKCPKLEALPAAERFGHLKDSKLCYNCLYPGHSTRGCNSRFRCGKCNGNHHTILCRTGTSAQTDTSNNGHGQAAASTSQPNSA